MITVDLGGRVVGQVIGICRHRKKRLGLDGSEVLRRPTRGGAVYTQPRSRLAPFHRAPLGVGTVDEVLAREEAAAHVWDGAFDLRLVLGVADPRGVDEKATVLGVFDEGLVQSGL